MNNNVNLSHSGIYKFLSFIVAWPDVQEGSRLKEGSDLKGHLSPVMQRDLLGYSSTVF